MSILQLNHKTTLNEFHRALQTQNRFVDFTSAIPLIPGYEHEPIGNVLVKLGVYKSGKQMKQELSPYSQTSLSILASFVPESHTRYATTPSWLAQKSKAISLIKIAAKDIENEFFVENTSVYNTYINWLTEDGKGLDNTAESLVLFLVGILETDIINCLKLDKGIDSCLIILASLYALCNEPSIGKIINNLVLHFSDPKELYRRLLSRSDYALVISELESIGKFCTNASTLGIELNTKLPAINCAHTLLVDYGDLFCRLVESPRAAYADIVSTSALKLNEELIVMHNQLRQEDGLALVEDSILDFIDKTKAMALTDISKVIKKVLTYKAPTDLTILSSFDAQLAELAKEGKYTELAALASKLAAEKETANQSYIDMAEFIQNSYAGIKSCPSPMLDGGDDKIEANSATLKEMQAKIDKLTLTNISLSIDLEESKTECVYSPAMIELMASNGTIHGVLTSIQAMFPNVVVTPSVLDQSLTSTYNKPSKLFQALYTLCSEYLPAINNGQPDSVAMKVLPNYRANESETTMTIKEYARHRQFVIPGHKDPVEFQQHITLGVRRSPTTTVQVFFGIIDSVLYITYVGPHLPVSST